MRSFYWYAATEPGKPHTMNAKYMSIFGSKRIGWLKEPNNSWCQNWVHVPDNYAGGPGYVVMEAAKIIPMTASLVAAVATLAAIVFMFAAAVWKWDVSMEFIGLLILIGFVLTLVFLGIFVVIGTDWAFERRERRRREQEERTQSA